MQLYTYPNNKNAYKALIAAEMVGVPLEVPPFKMGQDNKTPEFLARNPHGKVPLLVTEEGCFFESSSIARYVARVGGGAGPLLGRTAMERALIEQWISFAGSELDPAIMAWCLPLIGVMPYSDSGHAAAMAATQAAMDVLEVRLGHSGGKHLVGDHETLADVVCFCNLLLGYKNVFDAAYRERFPRTTAYFLRLAGLPEFHRVLGDVKLCEAPIARKA